MATTTRGRSPLGGGRTSNAQPSGVANGTPGGQSRQSSATTSMRSGVNEPTFYLWILVIVEALLMGYLRNATRRYHGG
jgi:hypothetical protein